MPVDAARRRVGALAEAVFASPDLIEQVLLKRADLDPSLTARYTQISETLLHYFVTTDSSGHFNYVCAPAKSSVMMGGSDPPPSTTHFH